MKKFILKTLFFVGIIVSIKLFLLAIILLNLTNDSTSYYGENSHVKTKVILVGSSNLEYNFDYKTLNESFKNYDIIGCNLNAPSGLYPTINKLKQLKTNSKDIVILCLPHSLYEKGNFFPFESYKKRGVSFNVLSNFVDEYPLKFIKKIALLKFKDSYRLIRHLGFKKKKLSDSISFKESPLAQSDLKYKDCWTNEEGQFFINSDPFEKEHLEEILKHISSSVKGTVLFRFPSIKKDQYNINEERLEFLSTKYPFINNFQSSMYDEKYWFNQWYHLNECGKFLNTKKLILELENKTGLKHTNINN